MAEQMTLTGARPLTIAHQGIAACLACWHAAQLRDPTMIQMLDEMVAQAHGDSGMAADLVKAARAVLDHERDVVGAGFQRVFIDVGHVVVAYYRARAAATHAKIFPETQL